MTDQSFIRAIIEDPADDAPRLIYADWLDEHGQDERAEFIRVQCESNRLRKQVERWVKTPSHLPGGRQEDGGPAGEALAISQSLDKRSRELLAANGTSWAMEELLSPIGLSVSSKLVPVEHQWSRGFISEITLNSRTLLGGVCECVRYVPGTTDHAFVTNCPQCKNGRIPGCAAAIGRSVPVERIRLVDKTPLDRISINDRIYWFRQENNDEEITPSHRIPSVIFDLLPADEDTIGKPYESVDNAQNALSAACVQHCRREAGISQPVSLQT